jgi:hypothetical protein
MDTATPATPPAARPPTQKIRLHRISSQRRSLRRQRRRRHAIARRRRRQHIAAHAKLDRPRSVPAQIRGQQNRVPLHNRIERRRHRHRPALCVYSSTGTLPLLEAASLASPA